MPEPRRLSAAEVSRCGELIHDRSGLDFPPSRLADLEQVIADTLAGTGLADADALLALLADRVRGEPVLQEMIVDLTVNETYFFRHQPQFHALEHHILPALIERRRPARHLRIWSAGCATGEEAYSLAILLERLLPDLADWNIHLLATDINAEVLAKAQRGCYLEWSFRHVAPEIKEKYFTSSGAAWELHPRLRARVAFSRLNLAEDTFPSFRNQTNDMDLILCRNVLIYFRSETVRRIVERFGRTLSDGGWLIVGHVEPSQTMFGRFTVRNFPGTVVYQKSADGSQESGIRGQESGVRNQGSGIRSQESGVRSQESGVRNQGASAATAFPISDPCLLIPDPCLLTPDPCPLTPDPCLLPPDPCLLPPDPCLLPPDPCPLTPGSCERVLEERARLLARPATQENAVKTVPLVELAIGTEHFGVHLHQVKEIQPLKGLTPVPGAAAHWAGVVNLRGRLFPVLDLRHCLGLPIAGAPEEGQVVVVSARNLDVALWTGDVLGVRHVPPNEIQPPPARADDAAPSLAAGVTTDLLTVLDIEALLAQVSEK